MNRVNLGNLFTKGHFIVNVTRGSVVFKTEPRFHSIDLRGNNLSVKGPDS